MYDLNIPVYYLFGRTHIISKSKEKTVREFTGLSNGKEEYLPNLVKVT